MKEQIKLTHLIDFYKSFPGVLVKIKINLDFSEECLFISENCKSLFGLSSKDLKENWNLFLDKIETEHKSNFKEKILYCVKNHERIIIDGNFNSDSGEVKWFQLTATIVDHTHFYILQGVYVDITEDKEKEIKNLEMKDTLIRLSRCPNLHQGKVEETALTCVQLIQNCLGVARSSFWKYDDLSGILTCEKLIQQGTLKDENIRLSKADFPLYFESMLNDPYILANDTYSNKYTKDFKESYLEPNQIYSLLDIPVFYKGKVIGVLCQEEVEQYRIWKESEILFLFQISEYISYCYSIHERNQFEREMEYMNQNLQSLISAKTIELESKNKDILDSIRYAQRIQNTILPAASEYTSSFSDSFVWYQPKDIVAGDFYWCTKLEEELLFAVCDCTGHGIPGAFLSIISYNILKQVVEKKKITEPHKILDCVNDEFNLHFQKEVNTLKDGMEIGLMSVRNLENGRSLIRFSGANISLYYANSETQLKLEKVRATKQSICFSETKLKHESFETILPKDSMIYLFTDGIFDQFGGEKQKKIKRNSILEIIQENITKTCAEQAYILQKIFSDWKGNLEQIDDVCVVGFKI